ncbi:sugar transporter [Salmonella enterica subsp. enterica serovar Sanjuan]|uniref:Sugar transporter n=1 Tax=Salmonella enterica subsp. enterica serovar Sanjuan TaxID=1160765 RepID=A0A447P1L4_SALET|nr:sugar transporter [Salmonella enterica subsp. enterica serovar Sanjuan]
MTSMQKWLRIGATLMFGLFVAYLDRSNLSVTLPTITHDLNIDGATASIVLTIFLIGYAFSNIFGGVFTQRYDPKKIVILMVLIWSIATVFVGFTSSVYVIFDLSAGAWHYRRHLLAAAVPLRQRLVFRKERTQANSIIQYYGQFLALGLGFMILSPLDAAFGWRNVFIITGVIGIVVVVPLYITMLKKQEEAPYYRAPAPTEKTKLTLESLGGTPFLLLIFTYITQGMLFWGITLWIPMVVNSLGYTGFSKALVSSLPYLTAVILAIPISWISDKTQKRVLIASLGLLIPGVMLFLLPFVDAPGFKITLITLAMGYYAASFTPNIWSIIQSNVKPHAIGPASGIINGIGAGGGGTLAGLMVGYFYRTTGSYMQGFMVLGCIVILGGASLLIYGRIRAHHARS